MREKRAALVAHATIQGLSPNASMKNPRIPCIKRIPAHWGVVRNKTIFREIDDRSKSGGEELLTVSHITGVKLRSEVSVNMFIAET